MKEPVLLAVFGAPHGVRGEIRLKSHAGDPADFDAYGPLLDARGRAYPILSKRHAKDDIFVVRVKGVDSREAAQALTHVELFVPREALPEAGEDEFYYSDLIGLAVFDEAGEKVGAIVAVENYGAGDILEIAPEGGGETILHPFDKSFTPVVDVKGGRVVIAAPSDEAS